MVYILILITTATIYLTKLHNHKYQINIINCKCSVGKAHFMYEFYIHRYTRFEFDCIHSELDDSITAVSSSLLGVEKTGTSTSDPASTCFIQPSIGVSINPMRNIN